tara:strand:+ start:2554 stop:3099 length:546 start_codon:yes stop_codon:yes gene_type:complete
MGKRKETMRFYHIFLLSLDLLVKYDYIDTSLFFFKLFCLNNLKVNSKMMNNMNTFEQIPQNEIQFFKEKVQRWLHVDSQIAQLEAQVKDLKKVRNKELEPEITGFMVKHNVSDLNTENGKLKCQERKTKKGLNKVHIRENLSKYLTEEDKLDKCMDDLWKNRPIVISHKLQKVKPRKTKNN